MYIPAGWKLVPINPTPEMIDAGTKADWVGECESREGRSILPDICERWDEEKESYEPIERPGIWASMLAAAPEFKE